MNSFHVHHHPQQRTYIEGGESDVEIEVGGPAAIESPQIGQEQPWEEDASDGQPGALSIQLLGEGGHDDDGRVLQDVDDVVVVAQLEDIMDSYPDCRLNDEQTHQ